MEVEVELGLEIDDDDGGRSVHAMRYNKGIVILIRRTAVSVGK